MKKWMKWEKLNMGENEEDKKRKEGQELKV